ncbi:hypothetical protein C4K29_3862 [Pseudomonas chlororaphis subsp. piscium]|nr:hypothetical protein C4K29_3862 [Pseudomonas chlororaphis subsp. piscium]
MRSLSPDTRRARFRSIPIAPNRAVKISSCPRSRACVLPVTPCHCPHPASTAPVSCYCVLAILWNNCRRRLVHLGPRPVRRMMAGGDLPDIWMGSGRASVPIHAWCRCGSTATFPGAVRWKTCASTCLWRPRWHDSRHCANWSPYQARVVMCVTYVAIRVIICSCIFTRRVSGVCALKRPMRCSIPDPAPSARAACWSRPTLRKNCNP